jgi:glycosyltransferase involved in cell wall biosynthesis
VKVAVLIPCYNEAATIRKVVEDFRLALPDAEIHVFDNNSSDDTAHIAAAAGANVVPSPLQGKGNVVRHMFGTVDADYYVMADGDDTYPASEAPRLIDKAVRHGADMIVGVRLEKSSTLAFRRFHRFGNRLISGLIGTLFRVPITDALSGYRVFSRAFVRGVPIDSAGFQIETELTLQAVAKGFSIQEVPVHYGERPEGSTSKLNTYRDGALIISAIILLFRDYKPLPFFAAIALIFLILSLASGSLPIIEYYQTGLVPHFPRAILAVGLALTGLLSLAIGIILDTLSKYHREEYQLFGMLRREIEARDLTRKKSN